MYPMWYRGVQCSWCSLITVWRFPNNRTCSWHVAGHSVRCHHGNRLSSMTCRDLMCWYYLNWRIDTLRWLQDFLDCVLLAAYSRETNVSLEYTLAGACTALQLDTEHGFCTLAGRISTNFLQDIETGSVRSIIIGISEQGIKRFQASEAASTLTVEGLIRYHGTLQCSLREFSSIRPSNGHPFNGRNVSWSSPVRCMQAQIVIWFPMITCRVQPATFNHAWYYATITQSIWSAWSSFACSTLWWMRWSVILGCACWCSVGSSGPTAHSSWWLQHKAARQYYECDPNTVSLSAYILMHPRNFYRSSCTWFADFNITLWNHLELFRSAIACFYHFFAACVHHTHMTDLDMDIEGKPKSAAAVSAVASFAGISRAYQDSSSTALLTSLCSCLTWRTLSRATASTETRLMRWERLWIDFILHATRGQVVLSTLQWRVLTYHKTYMSSSCLYSQLKHPKYARVMFHGIICLTHVVRREYAYCNRS